MRQHRVADHVADGEDVRRAGAHLRIDGDETAVADGDAGLLGGDLLAVGRATGRLQDHVVAHGFGRGGFAFEADVEAVVLGLDADCLGLEHDLVETVGVLLLPHLDRVAVRALHHRVEHFDDVDAGAERGVDGRHFEADDAAADDQHLLRNEAQFKRAGRIDDALIVRQERQADGRRTRGDDALLEADDLLAAGLVLGLAFGGLDFDVAGVKEAAVAAHDVDLAHLGHAGEAGGQFGNNLGLMGAQLVDVDARGGEGDAAVGHVRGFVEHCGDVQQRLGRDAADVEADAAERRVAFDDHGLESEVGAAEGGRVTAGARAEDQQVAFDVDRAAVAAGRSRRGRCRRGRRGRLDGRRGRLRGACSGRSSVVLSRTAGNARNEAAFGDLVADLDRQFGDHAVGRARDVDRGLVGLKGEQGVFGLDRVADLDQHVDDRDVLEVADVRHFDFDDLAHAFLPLRPARAACRRAAGRCTR